MARIRSLKPEAFQSETLSEVSVEAERTFYGLSTQADDRGRAADKPAVINGALWAVRSERKLHTAADLDDELAALEKVGAICRYVGCDGKRYLHFVTWDDHQKVDKASRSRLPRCPHHSSGKPDLDYCGKHGAEACPTPPSPVAKAPEPTAQDGASSLTLPEGSRESREPSTNPREDSGKPSEPSTLDLGPRTVDQGSFPPSAGTAPPRRDPGKPINAGEVVAAYVDGAKAGEQPYPAESLRKRIGKQAGDLIKEKTPPDVLHTAAFNAGASGWHDLAVQIQRDAAAAKDRQTTNGKYAPGSDPHLKPSTVPIDPRKVI